MPEELPNPNKLIFSGSANNEYDGKEEVSVYIPFGNESGWELLNQITVEEDTNEVVISEDSDGNSFKLSAFAFYIDMVASDSQTEISTFYIGITNSGYLMQKWRAEVEESLS